MWITSTTVNENIDMEQAVQQIIEFSIFIDKMLAESAETSGKLLPPYDSQAAAMAAFAPGVVFKRAWDLESSALQVVDFINNHSAKQLTATFDGQQDV